jgi:hypothetical protein
MMPRRKKPTMASFCWRRKWSLNTGTMGRTRMVTSSKKWVVIVPRKNLSLSILQTASVIVLSQIARVGTQRKISMKVRKIHHIAEIASSTKMGIRMIESLNSRQ